MVHRITPYRRDVDLSVPSSALVAKRKKTIIQRKSALNLKVILPLDGGRRFLSRQAKSVISKWYSIVTDQHSRYGYKAVIFTFKMAMK